MKESRTDSIKGPVTLTLPGNLLLMGEYAIVEESGVGIAFAADGRLTITVTPGELWEIEGLWPGGGERWRPGEPSTSLISQVFAAVLEELLPRRPSPARISIDSSAFFDGEGRKLGLGSSAAAAAGLTAALFLLAGRPAPASAGEDSDHPAVTPADLAADCALCAVRAHRRAQGGRGSGYDVLASLFGGWGLFRGGLDPSWSPLRPQGLPSFWLFQGPAPVRTTQAVAAYKQWKEAEPFAFQDFFDRSQAFCDSWRKAPNWDRGLPYLRQARLAGQELGDRIGVTAMIPAEIVERLPSGPGWFWKPLGAGNELGLLCGPAAPLSAAFRPIETSWHGLLITGASGETL